MKFVQIAALVLLAAGRLVAQTEPTAASMTSGPTAGTKLTSVPCYATNGPLSGKVPFALSGLKALRLHAILRGEDVEVLPDEGCVFRRI